MAYHAHPSPRSHASSPTFRELLNSLDVDFCLHGLSASNKARVSDVYCPQVRRSTDRNFPVSHLDVVSCWKGLSYRQAAEIAVWETMFKDAIENQVRDIVLHAFAEQLRDSNDFVNEYFLATRLTEFISERNPRYIDIDISALVHEMIGRFYDAEANLNYGWLISSRDLPRTICYFLRTRDCFIDRFPRPSLEVSFTCSSVKGSILVSGEVTWFPPAVDFINVPLKLPPGKEYRIVPDYKEPYLGSAFPPPALYPVYYVEPTPLGLEWDDNIQGFRAIVPDRESYDGRERLLALYNGSSKGSRAIETTLSAAITMQFPFGVRFEQTTRYCLKLEVTPRTQNHGLADVPNRFWSPEIKIPYAPYSSPSSDDAVSVHLSPEQEETPQKTPRVSSWLPSYSSTPLSKCGPVPKPRLGSSALPLMVMREVDSPALNAITRLSVSRNSSLWSCANFTDEVLSQVDGLNQNRLPGEDAHLSQKLCRLDCAGKTNDAKELVLLCRNESPISPRTARLEGELEAIINCTTSRMPTPPAELTTKTTRTIGSYLDNSHCYRLPDSNECGRRTVTGDSIDCFDRLQEDFRIDPSISTKPKQSNETSEQHPTQDHSTKDPKIAKPYSVLLGNKPMGDSKWNFCKKRKATKQASAAALFETPAAFQSQRLALDQFEHMDLELAAKRQRLSDRIDPSLYFLPWDTAMDDADGDDEWDDELVPGMVDVTTGKMGEASRSVASPRNDHPGWFETVMGSEDNEKELIHAIPNKSRAYAASASASKVMPALKKKGSVKRMVFQGRKKVQIKIPHLPGSPKEKPSTSTEGSPEPGLSIEAHISNLSASAANGYTPTNSAVYEVLASPSPSSSLDTKVGHATDECSVLNDAVPAKLASPSLSRSPSRADSKMEYEQAKETSTLLDQNEIQANYSRFLAEKEEKSKVASINLDGADDEARAYERLFLEDSQESEMDWDTESVGVGTNASTRVVSSVGRRHDSRVGLSMVEGLRDMMV
ncbi:uncharacterized protein BDR25DRAFT_60603 [Lindgomyces ingoldianus]|uniref:Uncharacterized protein n=1 Tax=Lindgomyces ingoldianus TaxID=673940 RepID=A0ACB6QNR1_9PLEO|nr:uncharacterized protein BDR25DRAFT_60603 [Lindgomyces ingoldianus]KAF2467922.1 hypothetical protein BDR25DRAFT_60603 [Lindgomyces ingoldianus]